jgi:Ca2+-binding EF-hand superfamily protein
MTADQMQARALRGFDRADADSDGVVTTAEIEQAVEAGQTGVRGWTRADRDGDGRLTRQEFQSVVAWRFQRADADQDGSVTVAERQAARQPAD